MDGAISCDFEENFPRIDWAILSAGDIEFLSGSDNLAEPHSVHRSRERCIESNSATWFKMRGCSGRSAERMCNKTSFPSFSDEPRCTRTTPICFSLRCLVIFLASFSSKKIHTLVFINPFCRRIRSISFWKAPGLVRRGSTILASPRARPEGMRNANARLSTSKRFAIHLGTKALDENYINVKIIIIVKYGHFPFIV